MIDWLASFGAEIIRLSALMALLCAAIWIGIKAHHMAARRLGRRSAIALGWLGAIATFLALIVVFGPAMDQLQRFACRDARDFDLCMDPPDAEYP